MHTDKHIYLLLGADPEFLHRLTGLRIAGRYRFDALDVKALERRIDGVVVPEDEAEPIWAIEVQAWRDPAIYHRLLIDMGLLGERYPGREVRGLLLFISPGNDPKTPPWDDCLTKATAHCPLRRLYLVKVLDQLQTSDPEHPLLAAFLPYRVEDRARLREQAPSAYRRLKQSSLSDFARRQCLDVFQSWLLARFDDLTLEEILAMLGELTPLEQTRAYREIVEKNRPIWFDEGHQEGHQEGRQREACTLILRLLKRRFGLLTSEREARITALPLERLEDLGEALLDFTTSADLDSWLARYE